MEEEAIELLDGVLNCHHCLAMARGGMEPPTYEITFNYEILGTSLVYSLSGNGLCAVE